MLSGQFMLAGKRPAEKGFQAAELLIATVIFLMISLLCFFAAAAGFRIFTQTTSRQILQRDARAIFAWLQRDAGMTNLLLCAREQRTSVEGQRIDSLGMAGMNSWQEPIALDLNGVPAWNRVIAYVVVPTVGEPGTLLRQVRGPGGAAIPLTEPDIASLLSSSAPPLDQRRLSGAIRSFAADISLHRQLLIFELVLEEKTVSGGTGRERSEVLELQTVIRPQNTWPRL